MVRIVHARMGDSRPPLLQRIVFRGLVFNMSWEDPEMDRRALEIKPTDTVISITSAGCNPLNFLCQQPERLICIDGNPAQNAVMELKLAALELVDYRAFFDIFAARKPRRLADLYPLLRPRLTAESAQFWDRNLSKAVRNGIYSLGRTGLFCRILRGYLRLLGIEADVEQLFLCDSLEEQRAVYLERIAPKLWRMTSRLFVGFKPLIYLAGVHPRQFQMIDDRHDMYDYLRERIDYALTNIPARDNYFLSLAATGRFRGTHVPPYLLEENFDALRRNTQRVTIVNGWLGPYLDSLEPGSIDKFNLLDIFDWMPQELFRSTMRSVIRAASPEARLIYRSGSYHLDPPPEIRPYLCHHADLSRELLAIDRSATYGGFYVYSVNHDPGLDSWNESVRAEKIAAV